MILHQAYDVSWLQCRFFRYFHGNIYLQFFNIHSLKSKFYFSFPKLNKFILIISHKFQLLENTQKNFQQELNLLLKTYNMSVVKNFKNCIFNIIQLYVMIHSESVKNIITEDKEFG